MTHVPVPDRDTEVADQHEFDEAVRKKGKVVLQALAGVGILAAILMSMIALNRSSQKSEAASAGQPVVQQAAATASAPVAAQTVSLSVVPEYRLGPDGKKHDAFTKTEFAVKVGQPLTLKINNTDDVPHSITSPVAGVNIMAMPGVHEYKLVVKQAGKFEWYCMMPCDTDANGWAMQHPGYMSGYITAT